MKAGSTPLPEDQQHLAIQGRKHRPCSFPLYFFVNHFVPFHSKIVKENSSYERLWSYIHYCYKNNLPCEHLYKMFQQANRICLRYPSIWNFSDSPFFKQSLYLSVHEGRVGFMHEKIPNACFHKKWITNVFTTGIVRLYRFRISRKCTYEDILSNYFKCCHRWIVQEYLNLAKDVTEGKHHSYLIRNFLYHIKQVRNIALQCMGFLQILPPFFKRKNFEQKKHMDKMINIQPKSIFPLLYMRTVRTLLMKSEKWMYLLDFYL